MGRQSKKRQRDELPQLPKKRFVPLMLPVLGVAVSGTV